MDKDLGAVLKFNQRGGGFLKMYGEGTETQLAARGAAVSPRGPVRGGFGGGAVQAFNDQGAFVSFGKRGVQKGISSVLAIAIDRDGSPSF